MASFLLYLTAAFQNWPEEEYRSSISHRTARIMLGDESLLDLGAFDFMGAKVGSSRIVKSVVVVVVVLLLVVVVVAAVE